jgi:hypothetical protein
MIYYSRNYTDIYTTSVEWVRPTLFRAASAQPTFEINRCLEAHALAALRFRRRDAKQVLCDRMSAIRAFQDLCSTAHVGGPMGLAFEVSLTDEERKEQSDGGAPALGKTWLLNELASQAALEGFVPCIIDSLASEVPANFLLFAIRLAEAMDDTREKFGCERRLESAALELAFDILKRPVEFNELGSLKYLAEVQNAKARLREPHPGGGEWADQVSVEEAIRTDLQRLLKDVAVGSGAPALIFIDDLHRYEGVEIALLSAVKTYGLGSRETPGPLVFTCSVKEKSGPVILAELKKRTGEIRREELTRFAAPLESSLAYRQYFLSLQYAPTSSSTVEKRKQTPTDPAGCAQ